MTQIEMLYRLQEIDLKMVQIHKRLEAIAAVLTDNHLVVEAQHLVQVVEDELKPLRANARDIELETEANDEKAKNTEKRLYGGGVSNPKELLDMQLEVAALKKRNAELDDRLLEVMLEIEAAEQRHTEKQDDLKQVTLTWESEYQQLFDEQSQLQSDVETMMEQRRTLAEDVSAENLNLYNSERKQKNNIAIAMLNGSTCLVCGVEQTSRIVQEARRGEAFVRCSSCGRILFRK